MEQQWLPSTHWRRIHGKGLANDPLAQLAGSEKSKLGELQRSLQAEGAWSAERHDLYALRRFLKARDWDVQRAKQMWLEMLAFRANNRVDHIFQEFQFKEKDRVLAAYPHGLHKVDREGRPVLYYKFGAVDLDALLQITNMQRLTQWHIQEYERIMRAVLPACSVRAGCHIEKIVSIIDVAGVRMRDIGRVLELLSTYIKVDSNNYPETLGAMIIINAPMWFSGSFGLVKRMLSAETQKKMQILGSSYQSALQAVIAPDNLLKEFGGMSTGNLGDSIGPWDPILEQMRVVEAAHQAQVEKPASGLDRKRSVEAARKSQEGGQHVGAVGVKQGPTNIVLHPPDVALQLEAVGVHAGQKHRLEPDMAGEQLPSRRSAQQAVQQAGPMQAAHVPLQQPGSQQGVQIQQQQQQQQMPGMYAGHMQGSISTQLHHDSQQGYALAQHIQHSSGGDHIQGATGNPVPGEAPQQHQQHAQQQGMGIHSYSNGAAGGHLHSSGSLTKPLSPHHSYKEALQSHTPPDPHPHPPPAVHPEPIPEGSSVHHLAQPSFVSTVTHTSQAPSHVLESYLSATEASSVYMSGEFSSIPFLAGTPAQPPIATPIAASVPPVPGSTGLVSERHQPSVLPPGWQQQLPGHEVPQPLVASNGGDPAHGSSPGSTGDAGVHAVLIPAHHAGLDSADTQGLLAKGGAVTDVEDDDGARSLVSFASCRSIDSVTGLSNGPASPRSTASKRLRYSGSGRLRAQPSVDRDSQPVASSWQPSLTHVDSVQTMPQVEHAIQPPVANPPVSNGSMTSRAGAVAVAAASKVMSALAHRMPRWLTARAAGSYERLQDQPPQPSPPTAIGGSGNLAVPPQLGETRKTVSRPSSLDVPRSTSPTLITPAAGRVGRSGSFKASHARAGSPPRPGAQPQLMPAGGSTPVQWVVGPEPQASMYSVDAHAAADTPIQLPGHGSITTNGVVASTPQLLDGGRMPSEARGSSPQPKAPYSIMDEEMGTIRPGVSPFAAAVPPTGGRYATQLVPEYVRAWLRTAADSMKHPATGSRQQLLDTHEGSAVVDHVGSYDVDADPFLASIVSPTGELREASPVPSGPAHLRRASEPIVAVSHAAQIRRSGSGLPHVLSPGADLLNRETESLMTGVIASDSGWSLEPPTMQAMSPPNHPSRWDPHRMQPTVETTLPPATETQPPAIRGMHARSRSGGRGASTTLDTPAPKPNGRVSRNGRRLPVSYEVYVDSDNEEEGGLLHMGGGRPLLPKYGFVRTWARRLFCCCRPI